MNSLSIAMVGCTGTGKTSLARRAGWKPQDIQETVDELEEPTLTIRCHKAVVSEDAAALQVDLWEAPIWELALDAESHFANGRDGVLFVLDCTRRETVDEVLLHWLHVARYHYGPQAPFLFVGMKKDLVPQEEVIELQNRLEQLQLPALIGSCLDPAFPSSMLKELLRLRRHGHAHRSAPLLAPLPLLTSSVLGEGRGNDQEVLPALQQAACSDNTPPHAPSEPKSTRESWQIAAGDLSISTRIDAAERGAWQGGGRSPSFFAYWANIPVVAKQVERPLLLKRCGSSKANKEEQLRRLLRELSQADCPYLAKFYGACFDVEPVYLVMEYMSGGDLERYLRSKRQELHRPWTPPRSLLFSWAKSAAGAVAFLAGLTPPIAHGNLRPSNLLLCTSLALRLSPSGALAPIEHRHQAEVGAPSLESCLYSAPEVLAGEPCDEVEKCIAADVFALGLVFWLMCTGMRPFQHLDNDGRHKPSDHVMEAFKEGRVPRPSLQAVKETGLRDLLHQAWHEKPEERPSPAAVLQKLQKIEAMPSESQCCNAM
ncbi:Tak1 [Symbiodinium natans]|uniref:Tak1 protein n=1 Tax=Symbiodinium natans TaxID=878477 RepID=A0A812GDT3_9DINO|nr:Tak1 [Symbiodinium natans]